MTKAKPMSLSEFAEYSAAVPKERHEDYNRMLSFVEDVVMRKAAGLVCLMCKRGLELRREKDVPAWLHYHNGEPSATCPAGPIHESQEKKETV